MYLALIELLGKEMSYVGNQSSQLNWYRALGTRFPVLIKFSQAMTVQFGVTDRPVRKSRFHPPEFLFGLSSM